MSVEGECWRASSDIALDERWKIHVADTRNYDDHSEQFHQQQHDEHVHNTGANDSCPHNTHTGVVHNFCSRDDNWSSGSNTVTKKLPSLHDSLRTLQGMHRGTRWILCIWQLRKVLALLGLGRG